MSRWIKAVKSALLTGSLLTAHAAHAQTTGMTSGASRTGSGGVSFGSGSSTSGSGVFSGGVFSQGSGSSTGATGTSGTGFTGFTGSTTGRTSSQSSTAVPSSSNPFSASYLNPMAAGSTKKSFSQPLYASVSTSSASQSNLANTGGNGFTTMGYRRNPVYITTLSDDIPLVFHAPVQLRADVTQVLAESTKLRSGKNIDVLLMDGGSVVLRGSVPDERERRLAESLVRLTPGVREVRNELLIVPMSATPVKE